MESWMNYFELLEVSSLEASPQEIDGQYKRLKAFYTSSEFIQKSGFSEPEHKAWLELLDEAYAVLSHPVLRDIYQKRHAQALADYFGNLRATVAQQDSASETSQSESGAGPEKAHTAEALAENERIRLKLLKLQKDPKMQEWIQQHTGWQGSDLQKVRLFCELSLHELAQVTKIKPFYLKALEDMTPEFLPAPVFVRGYLREYCRTFGLPASRVLSEYMSLFEERRSSLNKHASR